MKGWFTFGVNDNGFKVFKFPQQIKRTWQIKGDLSGSYSTSKAHSHSAFAFAISFVFHSCQWCYSRLVMVGICKLPRKIIANAQCEAALTQSKKIRIMQYFLWHFSFKMLRCRISHVFVHFQFCLAVEPHKSTKVGDELLDLLFVQIM